MDLIEIDVVGAESRQRRVDRRHDVLARQPAIVGVVAHRIEHLGRDHDLVARGEVTQRAAEDLFADADGIHVGGVEEVDAELERAPDERPRRPLRRAPTAPLRVANHNNAGQADDPDDPSNIVHRVEEYREHESQSHHQDH